MPLYEEKFVSPLAIRFSQERARPTFQDGRLVSHSLAQIKSVAWPWDHGGYDVLLVAPFPTIEMIRWQPKLRDEDGEKCLDDDGRTIMGESCWFTLDNRRLYCLQAAAASAWPKRAACVVHVLHDLPLSKTCPKKFDTRNLGFSVRLGRRNDQFNSRAVWSWQEVTKTDCEDQEGLAEEDKLALRCVQEDAAKEEWEQLVDVPGDMPAWRSVEDQLPNKVIETAASAAALETWGESDDDASRAERRRRRHERQDRYERQATNRADQQEHREKSPPQQTLAADQQEDQGQGERAPQPFFPQPPFGALGGHEQPPFGGLGGLGGHEQGYPYWGQEQPWDDPWAYQTAAHGPDVAADPWAYQTAAPGPDVAALWRSQFFQPPGPFGARGLHARGPMEAPPAPRFRMPGWGHQDLRGWGQRGAGGWPGPAGASQGPLRRAAEAPAPARPRASQQPAAAGHAAPPAPRPRAEREGASRAALAGADRTAPARSGLAGADRGDSLGAGASRDLGLGLPRAADGNDDDDDGEGCEQQ